MPRFITSYTRTGLQFTAAGVNVRRRLYKIGIKAGTLYMQKMGKAKKVCFYTYVMLER